MCLAEDSHAAGSPKGARSNGIISSLAVDVSPLLRALTNVLASLYIVGSVVTI